MHQKPNEILNLLDEWLYISQNALEKNGMSATLVRCRPTEKTARYIDLDTNKLVARATLWESGEINLAAIEGDTNRQLICEDHIIDGRESLFRLMENFITRIR